ncbi:MAG: hypothetical protein E6K70_18875 [Planctomycetota bacterium]|nr:MAG: hypothetical protein E6K70_18875 [Planctomycetota bacterium]
MGVGRGRNQPCWCGSGEKFKHCHLGRSEQEPVNPWQAEPQRRAKALIQGRILDFGC